MVLNYLRYLSQRMALAQLRPVVLAIGLSLVMVISSGCTTVNQLNSNLSPSPVELSILQVEPRSNGSYTVSGNTTLPDQTRITVSAVRYFKPTLGAGSSNYAILDRQVALVKQGVWETRLNLWQPSQNGQFQETWQTARNFNQRPEPESSVTFLATLEPAHQSVTLQQQVEALDPSVQAAIARFTTDGELYLQASKSLTVPPPPGDASTAVAATRSEPIRPQQVKPLTPANAQTERQSQTNTPLASDAFLR
jgi:hypothetical protein